MATSPYISPVQETLDAPLPPPAGLAAISKGSGADHPAIALVEGSSPHLSVETQHLLRGRLRALAIVLFLGFGAFFLKGLFNMQQIETPAQWGVYWAHLGVTLLSGLATLRLCRRCSISVWMLRVWEVLLVVAPALFFLTMQYVAAQRAATEGYAISLIGPWQLLIFTYAMFIPNSWQRASLFVGGLAACPALLIGTLLLFCPAYGDVVSQAEFMQLPSSSLLMLAISAGTAIYGLRMIGSLRQAAFAARELGQYRLKERIGAGGMGEVYLAEHVLMKRPCALKIIRPEKAGDPRVLARFEREVRATAKLSHWNTVEIFDYGRTENGTFYYVMEYLPGMSLAELVETHGPLPPSRLIYLLTQTCEALSEAHSHQVIHRDLKPGNIFAAQRGGIYDVAKLLDFGLAKPLAGPDVGDLSLTQDGAITGSPIFMSPEQALGEEQADARSDIYSLGAVAYYLLTGRPPFEGDKPLKLLLAHAHEKVTPPSLHRPEVPEDLEQVILRSLAKDPDDRYQDAESLRQALAECEAATGWNRELAADWWHNFGCPKKKALDAVARKAVPV